MEHPLDDSHRLLREAFRFDCADLDVSIYRILNHKRGVIGKFSRKGRFGS